MTEARSPSNRKLHSLDNLLKKLADRRQAGETIVFTNGCFDILHVGHVRYLRAARSLGDCLVVGINSDNGVRQLKGSGRPVNTLADRAEILAALPFVTYLVEFNTLSVEPLVRTIKPQVLVKGGDYTIKDVVGSKFVRSYGGKVVVVGHAPGQSTSNTIKRINQQKRPGKNRRQARRSV